MYDNARTLAFHIYHIPYASTQAFHVYESVFILNSSTPYARRHFESFMGSNGVRIIFHDNMV